MWVLKCKIPQNNLVFSNYFLDLKNGFCLTACSQVYNEITLDGNHTRMDETVLDRKHALICKNCPKLLQG